MMYIQKQDLISNIRALAKHNKELQTLCTASLCILERHKDEPLLDYIHCNPKIVDLFRTALKSSPPLFVLDYVQLFLANSFFTTGTDIINSIKTQKWSSQAKIKILQMSFYFVKYDDYKGQDMLGLFKFIYGMTEDNDKQVACMAKPIVMQMADYIFTLAIESKKKYSESEIFINDKASTNVRLSSMSESNKNSTKQENMAVTANASTLKNMGDKSDTDNKFCASSCNNLCRQRNSQLLCTTELSEADFSFNDSINMLKILPSTQDKCFFIELIDLILQKNVLFMYPLFQETFIFAILTELQNILTSGKELSTICKLIPKLASKSCINIAPMLSIMHDLYSKLEGDSLLAFLSYLCTIEQKVFTKYRPSFERFFLAVLKDVKFDSENIDNSRLASVKNMIEVFGDDLSSNFCMEFSNTHLVTVQEVENPDFVYLTKVCFMYLAKKKKIDQSKINLAKYDLSCVAIISGTAKSMHSIEKHSNSNSVSNMNDLETKRLTIDIAREADNTYASTGSGAFNTRCCIIKTSEAEINSNLDGLLLNRDASDTETSNGLLFGKNINMLCLRGAFDLVCMCCLENKSVMQDTWDIVFSYDLPESSYDILLKGLRSFTAEEMFYFLRYVRGYNRFYQNLMKEHAAVISKPENIMLFALILNRVTGSVEDFNEVLVIYLNFALEYNFVAEDVIFDCFSRLSQVSPKKDVIAVLHDCLRIVVPKNNWSAIFDIINSSIDENAVCNRKGDNVVNHSNNTEEAGKPANNFGQHSTQRECINTFSQVNEHPTKEESKVNFVNSLPTRASPLSTTMALVQWIIEEYSSLLSYTHLNIAISCLSKICQEEDKMALRALSTLNEIGACLITRELLCANATSGNEIEIFELRKLDANLSSKKIHGTLHDVTLPVFEGKTDTANFKLSDASKVVNEDTTTGHQQLKNTGLKIAFYNNCTPPDCIHLSRLHYIKSLATISQDKRLFIREASIKYAFNFLANVYISEMEWRDFYDAFLEPLLSINHSAIICEFTTLLQSKPIPRFLLRRYLAYVLECTVSGIDCTHTLRAISNAYVLGITKAPEEVLYSREDTFVAVNSSSNVTGSDNEVPEGCLHEKKKLSVKDVESAADGRTQAEKQETRILAEKVGNQEQAICKNEKYAIIDKRSEHAKTNEMPSTRLNECLFEEDLVVALLNILNKLLEALQNSKMGVRSRGDAACSNKPSASLDNDSSLSQKQTLVYDSRALVSDPNQNEMGSSEMLLPKNRELSPNFVYKIIISILDILALHNMYDLPSLHKVAKDLLKYQKLQVKVLEVVHKISNDSDEALRSFINWIDSNDVDLTNIILIHLLVFLHKNPHSSLFAKAVIKVAELSKADVFWEKCVMCLKVCCFCLRSRICAINSQVNSGAKSKYNDVQDEGNIGPEKAKYANSYRNVNSTDMLNLLNDDFLALVEASGILVKDGCSNTKHVSSYAMNKQNTLASKPHNSTDLEGCVNLLGDPTVTSTDRLESSIAYQTASQDILLKELCSLDVKGTLEKFVVGLLSKEDIYSGGHKVNPVHLARKKERIILEYLNTYYKVLMDIQVYVKPATLLRAYGLFVDLAEINERSFRENISFKSYSVLFNNWKTVFPLLVKLIKKILNKYTEAEKIYGNLYSHVKQKEIYFVLSHLRRCKRLCKELQYDVVGLLSSRDYEVIAHVKKCLLVILNK